jgi:UDP:flavonoid glycosyltransferase YjiC (YdhE family)
VPQIFDQPYWGRQVYELGCGPAPVRLRKLTPTILATALDELATDQSYELAAKDVQDRLLHENGTGLAVDVIEETIAEYPGNARVPELIGEAS